MFGARQEDEPMELVVQLLSRTGAISMTPA
jgi:hypothetical protein